MAKQQKLARLRYEPEGTNGERESYVLELKTENEWGLICRCYFHKSAEIKPEAQAEKSFIHFSLIKEIFKLLTLGYKVYME